WRAGDQLSRVGHSCFCLLSPKPKQQSALGLRHQTRLIADCLTLLDLATYVPTMGAARTQRRLLSVSRGARAAQVRRLLVVRGSGCRLVRAPLSLLLPAVFSTPTRPATAAPPQPREHTNALSHPTGPQRRAAAAER
ncbi:MAG: hypothetical protein ACK40D_03240, partial [Cyanobacteriota bacterium]